MLLLLLYPTPGSYPLTRARDNAEAISFGFEFGKIVKLTHLMSVLIDKDPFHWIKEAHSGVDVHRRDHSSWPHHVAEARPIVLQAHRGAELPD